ncbi:tetratricopeptide repeat protein [Acaryochloris marina NIES-2412]|uniref:tetratricopeptide repeat protein n=1 Tax=Acaryochloris marina TaxID=155978 RepID=UPI0040595EA9
MKDNCLWAGPKLVSFFPSQKVLIILLLSALTGLTLERTAISQTATIYRIVGSGNVHLQRERTTGWRPVRKGTTIRQGDQLRTDRGVIALVKCRGAKKPEPVSARRPQGFGSICLQPSNRDWKGSQAFSTIGGIEASIPYLITPRHSLLLDPQPVLRWNPVANATEYTVVVSGPDGELWRIQTPQSRVTYGGPPLTPGVSYSVVVTTNTGQSSQADAAPNGNRSEALGFRVLRPAEANVIRSKTAEIARDPIADVADAIAVARLYSDFTLDKEVISQYGLEEETYQTYSLTADAIALLETVVQKHPSSSLLHRTLADLYWQTGLLNLAVDHYSQAIQGVEGLADLEDWTLSHQMLGKINSIRQNYSAALQSYRQAQVGYRFLGNDRLAKVMQGRAAQVERKL